MIVDNAILLASQKSMELNFQQLCDSILQFLLQYNKKLFFRLIYHMRGLFGGYRNLVVW